MILGLGFSSSSIFCSSEIMEIDMDEAVAADQARDEVLTDLAELYPAQVERIIADEVDLESTFNSVRNFVNKKNKEIESLSQQAAVSEADIARLAIELADAQAALAEAEASNNVKNKKALRQGQPIKDALMKAQQSLKLLSNQAISGFVNYGKKAGKAMSKSVAPKKSKSKKAARAEQPMLMIEEPIVIDSADEAIAMMDNQLAQDEVVVQAAEGESASKDKGGKNKDQKGSKKDKKSDNKGGKKDNSVESDDTSDEVVVQAAEGQDAPTEKTGKGKGKKSGNKKGKKDDSVESQNDSEDDLDA